MAIGLTCSEYQGTGTAISIRELVFVWLSSPSLINQEQVTAIQFEDQPVSQYRGTGVMSLFRTHLRAGLCSRRWLLVLTGGVEGEARCGRALEPLIVVRADGVAWPDGACRSHHGTCCPAALSRSLVLGRGRSGATVVCPVRLRRYRRASRS
jgi:hypothetical protein